MFDSMMASVCIRPGQSTIVGPIQSKDEQDGGIKNMTGDRSRQTN